VFNGSPEFKDDGTMYIPNPDPVRYVGDPKEFPEIDENWENLVYGKIAPCSLDIARQL
jgi:hypothetical protein